MISTSPQPLFAEDVARLGTFSVDESLHLSARWVFPVTGPPIENGVVAIRNGRIADVGTALDRVDLPHAALLPRLVNLHTHWELSSVRQPLAPGKALPEWIPHVISHRSERRETPESAVSAGRAESAASGTGLCVDVSQANASSDDDRVDVFPCREVIGFNADRTRAALDSAAADIATIANAGVSPHAPYSVGPQLLRDAIDLACEHGRLVTMHVAECASERELLEHRSGPLRVMLERFGIWRDDLFRDTSITSTLESLLHSPRLIVAHGNYLEPSEWRLLAGRDTTAVAYCPRTHEFFKHTSHPIREMMNDGVLIGLGTDSRASSPDLSLWSEVRHLWIHRPDIEPSELLQLATINGAKALGRAGDFGSIAAGREGNLLAVPLVDPDATDPYRALLGRRTRSK